MIVYRKSKYKSIFILVITVIAIFETLILVRHDVIKKILINRGLVKQIPTERSDYQCLMGWENCLRKMNYKADVCFIGNSIIFNSDFQKDYPDKKIVNLGYSGDCIDGMLIRYKQVSSVSPTKIFIMAGINDLTHKHLSIERFRETYNQLIDSILFSNPRSNLYLQSILPVNHRLNSNLCPTEKILQANTIIQELAGQYSLTYIDLYSLYADENGELPLRFTKDGIHLYDSAYKLWSKEIIKFIEE